MCRTGTVLESGGTVHAKARSVSAGARTTNECPWPVAKCGSWDVGSRNGAHISLQGADQERSNLSMILRDLVASGGYCYLLAVVRERPHFDRSARDRAGRLRDEVNDLI